MLTTEREGISNCINYIIELDFCVKIIKNISQF